MSDLDTVLLDLGYEWSDISKMNELQKQYEIAWQFRDWETVEMLQDETGIGTPDEREMAKRYKSRAAD